jgi:uncharacterized Ntn-hydrolase superfamily protein
MTWSIIALDPETGFHGIAIATRFFAVGAVCPYTAAGAGAISTQALVNPTLGPRGLALLRDGVPAPTVLDMLVRPDEGRAQRQVHLLDRDGRNAAHTGDHCIDWAGHVVADGVSVAGNMLAGEGVVAETLATYQASAALPFVERLLTAMNAGEAAGGDKRGKQSAALMIQGPEPYRRLDLRVDDHPDPLAELRRLYGVARERFVPYSYAFPTAERPWGILDRDVIERLVERHAGEPLHRTVPIPEE